MIATWQFAFHYWGLNYTTIFTLIETHPLLAPLMFVIVYVLGVVALIPTLPLNLGAGVLFGGLWGGLLATIGSTLGSMIAFLIARVLSSWKPHRFSNNKIVCKIDDELQNNGWRIIALVRLCSAVPTGPMNYLFGFTNLGFRLYSFATFIFLFPPSVVTSIIGNRIGTYFLSDKTNDFLHLTAITLTGVAILLFVIPSVFKKVFKLKRENLYAIE